MDIGHRGRVPFSQRSQPLPYRYVNIRQGRRKELFKGGGAF